VHFRARYFFSIYVASHHLDLHSFPTRRSSDLGRILSEGPHFIQARSRNAENWRGRSVAARSSPGDLHDVHNQGRRPEICRRCAEQPCGAGKIKMAALHVIARIRRGALSFGGVVYSKTESRKKLGTPSARRNSQSAERFAI